MPVNIPAQMYVLKACTCIYANLYLTLVFVSLVDAPELLALIKCYSSIDLVPTLSASHWLRIWIAVNFKAYQFEKYSYNISQKILNKNGKLTQWKFLIFWIVYCLV